MQSNKTLGNIHGGVIEFDKAKLKVHSGCSTLLAIIKNNITKEYPFRSFEQENKIKLH